MVIAGAPLSGLAPIPELGFVLQLAGLGAVIGMAFTSYRRHRNPVADTSMITTTWTPAALGVGMLASLLDALALLPE